MEKGKRELTDNMFIEILKSSENNEHKIEHKNKSRTSVSWK